jgi:hypothetical protein
MKKNIKNLSLALLALSMSAPAFADDCYDAFDIIRNPFAVTVPNQQGGFSFGADALYMKPSVPNGAYLSTASPGVTPTAGITTSHTIQVVNPSYQWGFDVNAAYRIPCSGNDISILWTYLGNNNDHNDNIAFPTRFPIGGGVFLPATTTANANLDFNGYNAVDLDFGQRINFGDYFNFRLFTGLRGVQIKENVNRYTSLAVPGIPGAPATSFFTDSVQDNSKFSGVGPQFGIDGRFCLGYGIGLDANATVSLLIGTIDASTHNLSTVISTTSSAITTNIDLNNKSCQVVPALDSMLGLDYTYNFNNCNRSTFVVQAGWKVIEYWDVAHDMFANGGHGDVIFGGTSGRLRPNTPTNIGFSGPYAGIKVNL